MSESPTSLNALKIAPGAGGVFFVSESPISLNASEIAFRLMGLFLLPGPAAGVPPLQAAGQGSFRARPT
jgi:hypothetical protein